MNSPHKRHTETIQQSRDRLVGLDHKHLDNRMRIAVIGRVGVNDLPVVIIHQFCFRQVQMQHPVFLPAFFDRTSQRFHILEQGDHFPRIPFGIAFKDRVGFQIGQPIPRTDHTVVHLAAQDIALRIVGDIDAFGKPPLIRLERTNPIRQHFRQHRDHLFRQIDTVAANACLFIQRRILLNKCTDIGDMHPQLPVAGSILF